MKILRRFFTKRKHLLIVCKLVECEGKYYWVRDDEIQGGDLDRFFLKENCDHVPIVRNRLISNTIKSNNKLAKYCFPGAFYIDFLDSDFTDVYSSSDQVDDQPH